MMTSVDKCRMSGVKLFVLAWLLALLSEVRAQSCEDDVKELKFKVECYKVAHEAKHSRHCDDAVPRRKMKRSGQFKIYPNGVDCERGRMFSIDVYCDQKADGGGWIVIQKRRIWKKTYRGPKLNFFRSWREYRKGFGKGKEFWLGLDDINRITRTGDFELLVELELSGGKNSTYAKYEKFAVGTKATNYELTVSGYTGTAGDSLSYHNGNEFTTYDRDNDGRENVNCAQENWGAWWYSAGDQGCHRSNLNGRYNRWFKSSPIRHIEMKIRKRRERP